MKRRARCRRSGSTPVSSHTTTIEAKISTRESSPKPTRATDRAERAAMARTTIPATFQTSVAHSNARPRRRAASACTAHDGKGYERALISR